MNVLITGGAGFIGTYAAEKFLAMGHEVTILDNLETGDRASVPAAARFILGDVRDPRALDAACQGREAVVHLAAMVSVSRSFEEPEMCRQINVDGTRQVLSAADRAGVGRVVLASTAGVYGNGSALPNSEDLAPQPASPYAYSKWMSEVDAGFSAKFQGVETVCLRFFNVYGPRQRPDSPYSGVISIAVARIIAGEPFTVFGDGLQTRDFVYVEDVVEGIVAAATRADLGCDTINVGTGRQVSILELLRGIEAITGLEARLVFGPPRQGDVRNSVAAVARMRERLGIEAEVPLDKGLAATIAWIRANAGST